MEKRTSFDRFHMNAWPEPEQLKPYFIAPKGQEWFYDQGSDGALLTIYGLNGTENLTPYKERIDVHLSMVGNPDLGVLLIYQKFEGGFREAYSSKGDMSRTNEWVRTLHSDAMPVSLFIPFAEAWKAVKEFMEAFLVEVEHQGDKKAEEQQESEFGHIKGADNISCIHFTFLSWNIRQRRKPGRMGTGGHR